MSHSIRLCLVPAYLLLCLVFGGASAAGFWSNMFLQLLAIPIIFWSLLADRNTPMSTAARQLMALLAAMLAIIALQLVPLPPSVWMSFPGRETIAAGYVMLNQPPPWLPISLAPHQTIASALWLLPAVATVLAIVRLGYFKASWVAWVIACGTTAGVLVGGLQITSGSGRSSPWYFYEITNYGFATGFFSNANHMATALVVTIPFLTALYLNARTRARSAQRSSGMLVILAGALTVVIVGIAINNSLAGMGLVVPVLAASFLMIRSSNRRLSKWTVPAIAALAAISVYVVFSAPFGNNLTAGGAENSPFSRYTSFSNSLEAAGDFFPLGSGIGTFVDIYPAYEDAAAISRTYINHVHSDYIELALETGVLGLAVVAIFLIWWASRTIAIWRAETADYFACAATIASFAILAHSIVDYPLRTAAIGALFAVCCALMAEPRSKARHREASHPGSRARHLSAD